MKKGWLVGGIVATIINVLVCGFCVYMSACIVTEGPGAIALIAIIPYSFICWGIMVVLSILSLVFLKKAIKSESRKISITARVFRYITYGVLIAMLVTVVRIVRLYFR